MFPTISEAFDDERVSVGPDFFNRWMTPLGLTLLFLAGAAPLLAYRRTTREKLWNQFLFPLAATAVAMTAIGIGMPRTLTLTPIFAKSLELPIPLLTLGIIVFVFASVGQEFWRGAAVRRRQTGSDPMTSLIGLVLTKRRKYGGYVIHLGVAVLFLGFVGKAYEQMTDRTIQKPAQIRLVRPGELSAAEKKDWVSLGSADVATVGKVDRMVKLDDPAWFSFRGYRFLYEGLEEKNDDNKTADIAKVSIWTGDWKKMTNGAVQWRDLERIATGYPGRNDYHKGEQPTTEVSINTRLFADFRGVDFAEDVYLVLSGFDIDSQTANFRIFVNPLINFVWSGFILLAFGVFICLIPQGLVDRLSPRPRTQLGRAADLAGVLLLVGGIMFGTARAAHADNPSDQRGGAEHVDETRARRMGHDDGGGYAHLYRPTTAIESDLMKELVCMCGGCQRESLYACKCAQAADDRRRVLELLSDFKSQGMSDDQASKAVIKAFVREYGGEDVLATPRSKMSWLLPSVAVIGGLGLLFAVGYRWVARGKSRLATSAPGAAVEDDDYAERLDDELGDTD